ncbi:MAG: hypothetical protein J1D87_01640 [Lachnospiraceae bacterium]|nr:hypothetical protein [Lachnospiraceae bacterium]
MVNKLRKLKTEFDEADSKFTNELNSMKENVKEVSKNVDKTLNDLSNINIIISDIDKNFAEKTSITNIKDMRFLWGATALQCGRWMLIPAFDEKTLTPNVDDRKSASTEGRKDLTKTGKQLDKSGENVINNRFINCSQIMALPVPYDAMKGTEDIVIKNVTLEGKNLSGGNHHSATWGHDPIIGHIIGTANILTRSISFRDRLCTTRIVEIPYGREQIVTHLPYNFIQMIGDVRTTLSEDKNRLAAAHLKQVLHFQSDKFTKDGLPIPLIPPGMQQRLLKQKWNSKELENVLKGSMKGITAQFAVAALLNTSVGILHGFCFNESKDKSLDLYSVRTRKVVAASNILSSVINIAAIAGGATVGILSDNQELIKKSIAHIDIGGYVETIHQIAKYKALQETIRREFLEMELYNRLCSETYSFLEEAHYEQEKEF